METRRRTTHVDVPNTLIDIIRAGSVAELTSFTTNVLVPSSHLETPDRSREKACANEVEEAGRQNKEELEFGARTTPELIVSIDKSLLLEKGILLIQEVPNTAASEETDDSR
jgi:hypothetical protein